MDVELFRDCISENKTVKTVPERALWRLVALALINVLNIENLHKVLLIASELAAVYT